MSSSSYEPEPEHPDAAVTEQAQELQRDLLRLAPTFFKVLSRSDVSGGNALDLPSDFCNSCIPAPEGSLPEVDIRLLDGRGRECVMKYLFREHTFIGDWRDFYLKNKLLEGDALVFHQIENYKFMVFNVIADKNTVSVFSATSGSLTILCLAERVRNKYYMLCASQKQFLHSNAKGLNVALVIGMMVQIISIVDDIKTANFKTPLHYLEHMENTLKSLEVLGMAVGFLRVNVNRLVELSRECQMLRASVEEKWAEVAEHDRALTVQFPELQPLMNSVEFYKKWTGEFEAVVDTLNTKSKLFDVEVKNIVDCCAG